jgi:hypothetical protein
VEMVSIRIRTNERRPLVAAHVPLNVVSSHTSVSLLSLKSRIIASHAVYWYFKLRELTSRANFGLYKRLANKKKTFPTPWKFV